MTHRVRFTSNLIKLAITTVVSALLFVFIINAIKNPVQGPQRTFTADFTDASGLHLNGDVRTKGVLIGKVNSIDLVRQNGHSVARVRFSLKLPYRLTENTVLAIKYQNLTGIRYIDYSTSAQPGPATDHLSADRTKPSFDITRLFNGLQPVLSTMNTNDLNTFTANAISVLQGDGSGLAPMLDSIQKLADYTTDRQHVISMLVANLNRVADAMGGKSSDLIEFLHSAAIPIEAAMTVLDKFPKTATFGPPLTEPVDRLLTELGLEPDLDVDQSLGHTLATLPNAGAALRLLPNALAALQLPAMTGKPGAMLCRNGVLALPTDVKVLLNGSEVTVCNPA